MEIKIIEDNFDITIFNNKATHPLQSWQWGEARKQMGIDVLRVGEFENNILSNTFQITIHPIPYTRFKIGYLPRSIFPSNEVLQFLTEHCKKNNIIFIKIEPYVSKSQTNSPFSIPHSPFSLFPDWTQILDLTKTEEELMKNLKSKTRYNIKLAQKKDVIIKEMSNDEGFKIFSKLYFETCSRQKYFGHNEIYHQIIFENLKNNISHILIAFYKNIPLAAYELFYINNIFYYTYGGTSIEYRNLMASNLLMWEAIKMGKNLGAKKFDMWGSLAPNYDQKHEWAGFTRFKEGYGCEFVEIVGSYDLIINKTYYSLYNVANQFRKFYLAVKLKKFGLLFV